jgi:HAD superfamily phosphoserine phosphatase-like hydrolase
VVIGSISYVILSENINEIFMKKKNIYIFDFDGTLTTRDTLLQLAFYFFKNGFFIKFLIFIIVFIGFKLKYYSNIDLKKKFVKLFFKNKKITHINSILESFLKTKVHYNIEVYDAFKHAVKNKEFVLIVPANFDIVVNAWLKMLDVRNVEVMATKVEYVNSAYTGGIIGDVCRGKIKAEQLKKRININEYFITSYADEKSDQYIMSLADEKIWIEKL